MRGYGDRVRSYEQVAALFNNTYPDREPIAKSTVQKTVIRFDETGSVTDRQRTGRPKLATNLDKGLEVMQTFVENPHSTVRKAAQAHDISTMSIHRILVKEKWHPFKIKITQELSEDDFDRRNEFYDEMMRRYDDNNNYFDHIIFFDEASFELNGAVNRHNCRYWSDENPHWMRDLRTQYPQKLNVWAGFCERGIVRPFFINGNLNAAIYQELLQNEVIPALENMFDGNIENIWFQQDGAGPHYAVAVRQFLDNTFPNRWIGRRGQIEWPARSPDLTPSHLFVSLSSHWNSDSPGDISRRCLQQIIITQFDFSFKELHA
ncbi:uncharacterized protein LOC113561483 [Ooceraea biroi]|uniref:uncharacterized protein LOC113561483 n=1 Tax=Ooceraea biroi TaxID=2015173 RepID=UPI000F07DE12|nr:uncharacterized protein LOC113561483 [Ooceraea biroi]